MTFPLSFRIDAGARAYNARWILAEPLIFPRGHIFQPGQISRRVSRYISPSVSRPFHVTDTQARRLVGQIAGLHSGATIRHIFALPETRRHRSVRVQWEQWLLTSLHEVVQARSERIIHICA